MKKLNIQLPKDIQSAPLEVRQAVLDTLRQAMALPQEMKVTRSGGNEHNMWERNHDELTADVEDDFYDYLQMGSAQRMADVFAAFDLSMDGVDMDKSFSPEYEAYVYDLQKSGNKRQAKKNAKRLFSELVQASKEKREQLLKFLEDGNPLSKKEMTALNKMMKTKLPEYAVKVEAFMSRAGFLGKIRNQSEKENFSTMGTLIDRFPATIQLSTRESVVLTVQEERVAASEGRKVTILPLTPEEARAVSHATHSAADKVKEVDARQEAGIRQVIIRAKKERWSAHKLAQELFDLYGEQNRDWRRVAITELSMAENDAYLSGLQPGENVVGMGAEDACKHCKALIIGKQFTVLPKADETQRVSAVWAGKTNYGRKVAEYVPCAPLHPNCRCRWHRLSRFYKLDDNGKHVLKTTAELINEERVRRGMAPDPNL